MRTAIVYASVHHGNTEKVGGIAKGHPNEEDMKNAADFVKGLH